MKRHFRPNKLAFISSHLWYLVCVKGEGHQETCQVRLQAPDLKIEGMFLTLQVPLICCGLRVWLWAQLLRCTVNTITSRIICSPWRPILNFFWRNHKVCFLFAVNTERARENAASYKILPIKGIYLKGTQLKKANLSNGHFSSSL